MDLNAPYLKELCPLDSGTLLNLEKYAFAKIEVETQVTLEIFVIMSNS